MSFVHLNVHSEYSLVDGIARIAELPRVTRERNMSALALTDRCNVFGAIKFWKAARTQGIKPIIGAELNIQDPNRENLSRMLFLCQHNEGFRNLGRLITRSYMEGQIRGVPYVKRHWLEQCNEGLIAINTIECSHVPLVGMEENLLAESVLDFWLSHFPDRFYLELCRTGHSQQESRVQFSLALAAQYAIPVIASNRVCFLHRDDYEAHEARVCVSQGYTLDDQHRPRDYTEQQYLRSAQEMITLFSDLPEAIENTVQLAMRCNVHFRLGDFFLPHFPIPNGSSEESVLSEMATEGLNRRLQERGIKEEKRTKMYQDRLVTELAVIRNTGYPGYFLIVHDFIRWARENSIPVGPGRGSGSGSLVAWALGITEIDPLQFSLLFERFLNPERVSLPDFDVDFCMLRRDEVIAYVIQKYGEDRVSRIITFGSMSAKAVVRDVGRVLGSPFPFVDRIAKLIPNRLDITLREALKEDALATEYAAHEDVKTLIDLALKLEGLPRNVATHAGGLVIAPSALTDYMPLYCESSAQTTATQFDMDDIAQVGLVKFDFLGLRTLTIIHSAVDKINAWKRQKNEASVEISKLPLDDMATYKLICDAKTSAVFQLESHGLRHYLKALHPDSFDELVAMIALYRPGPMKSGMVEDFIKRKHHSQEISYLDERLKPVLQSTKGVIIYQEQVMQIAQVLAGYSLGEADLLRRAMGKKKPEEMRKQRQVFTERAMKNGISSSLANRIFDHVQNFAGYGFNKSHSVAYALIAFQTAWLKTHYPAYFMAAVMTADMSNTDKIALFIRECRALGIRVLPPSVNHSEYHFSTVDESTVRYGLGAIKGVGESAILCLVEERGQGGMFDSLHDVCSRVDLHKLNLRVLEVLIKSGALDVLGKSRAGMMARLSADIMLSEQQACNARSGQDDLFGFSAETVTATTGEEKSMEVDIPEWFIVDKLNHERSVLGFYLSGHPLEEYVDEYQDRVTHVLDALELVASSEVVVAAVIISVRRINKRRDGSMIELLLSDRTGEATAIIKGELAHSSRQLLIPGQVVIIAGRVVGNRFSSQGYAINITEIYNMQQLRGKYAKLRLAVCAGELEEGFMDALEEVITPCRPGDCGIVIEYSKDRSRIDIVPGENWRVSASDELISRLRSLLGAERVHISYENTTVN